MARRSIDRHDGMPSNEVWSWRPTVTPALRRNSRIAGFGVAAATAASLAFAVATPGRFAIVLTVLLGGIGVLWWREHRRFSATEVSLAADGTLHVADGRTSASIDLASVDAVAVRLRTQPGLSVHTATPKWTIELSGPDGALTHPIAHAAGLFNPDRSDVERLEAELSDHARQWSGPSLTAGTTSSAGASGTDTFDRSTPSTVRADAPSATGVPMGSEELGGRFEWRPPVSPKADRRRRWFRVAYVGVALAVAVFGAATAWGDWVGVVLSALTVPGMLLAICGGLDWALGRARRFVLVVDGGELSVGRPGSERRIDLRGASVSVDRTAQHVSTGSTVVRTTSWMLTVQAADGAVLKQMFPGFGTTTLEADYVALERELRRRT